MCVRMYGCTDSIYVQVLKMSTKPQYIKIEIQLIKKGTKLKMCIILSVLLFSVYSRVCVLFTLQPQSSLKCNVAQ